MVGVVERLREQAGEVVGSLSLDQTGCGVDVCRLVNLNNNNSPLVALTASLEYTTFNSQEL